MDKKDYIYAASKLDNEILHIYQKDKDNFKNILIPIFIKNISFENPPSGYKIVIKPPKDYSQLVYDFIANSPELKKYIYNLNYLPYSHLIDIFFDIKNNPENLVKYIEKLQDVIKNSFKEVIVMGNKIEKDNAKADTIINNIKKIKINIPDIQNLKKSPFAQPIIKVKSSKFFYVDNKKIKSSVKININIYFRGAKKFILNNTIFNNMSDSMFNSLFKQSYYALLADNYVQYGIHKKMITKNINVDFSDSRSNGEIKCKYIIDLDFINSLNMKEALANINSDLRTLAQFMYTFVVLGYIYPIFLKYSNGIAAYEKYKEEIKPFLYNILDIKELEEI